MPYLPPELVLDRLSTFTSDEVIGYVGAESSFARSQVGSMASTLGFLSREVEHQDDALLTQYESLLDLCDDLEEISGADAPAVVREQREILTSVDTSIGNTARVNRVVIDVFEEFRQAIAAGSFGEQTPQAREALYDRFQTRVESQLQMLGRE